MAEYGLMRRTARIAAAIGVIVALLLPVLCRRRAEGPRHQARALPAVRSPAASPPARADTARIPGLEAPARIVLDRYGIPHLQAATLGDLYIALGFVTARDRSWQLELGRRSARGELSEWLGNRALRGDGGAQLFELAERAARIWEREYQDSTVRVPLEHFAAGVNAYWACCRAGVEPWAEEFTLLGRTSAARPGSRPGGASRATGLTGPFPIAWRRAGTEPRLARRPGGSTRGEA